MGSGDTFGVTEGSGEEVSTKTLVGGEHVPLYDQAPSKVVETLVRIGFAALVSGGFSSFITLGLTLTNGLYLFFDNTTDADIDLSYDGTNVHYCVRAKSAREIILKETETNLRAKYLSAPTEGEITAEVTR